MGCGASKVDDLDVTTLLRRRSDHLTSAVTHRNALAVSHLAYFHSLRSLGLSLHRFFLSSMPPDPPPLLPLPLLLPDVRKNHPIPSPHLHSFHSDSDLHDLGDEEEEEEVSTKVNLNFAKMDLVESTVGFETAPVTLNFARNGPVVPTVGFQTAPEDNDPFYSGYGGYYGGEHIGNFGGKVKGPEEGVGAPPSPPKVLDWDYLNPFDVYQSYPDVYAPSRSSRDLREEEGIPELEEEVEVEVKKEDFVEKNLEENVSGGADLSGDGASSEEEGEADLMEKSVVVEEVLQRLPEVKLERRIVPGSRAVPDAVHEIKTDFDKASACCEEVGALLEVGKLPNHKRKYEVVSSKLYAITPTMSTAAKSKNGGRMEKSSSVYPEFGKESIGLSSTLQKLSIWEKKLQEEVMVEEKMQFCHDEKCKRLKRLDDRGAELHKIESTRASVLKLSTEIRVAMKVVNSITNRIDKLRDEELWPQLYELIQGLVRMWQIMTECHKGQCEAVIEASNLDGVASTFAGKLSDAHLEATLQLGLELLNWIEIFSSWIDAQKSFVKSLNDWLLKYLLTEPELTTDGLAPFSPGRLGAPCVFVICNHWSQVVNGISENEVVVAMQAFTASVLQVWRQHYEERRSRITGNKSTDKGLRALNTEDKRIHKAVDVVNKRRAQVARQNNLPYTGEIVSVSDASNASGLHKGLQEIFEAMERFSQKSLEAYIELHARCEEHKAAKGSTPTS